MISSVLCLVAQSYLTLYDPMDCSPPGSSVHGDSPGKNTRVGCHALLQGIFPTQGSNPDLPHCKQVLYQLSYQGSPRDILYLHKFLYTHFKTLQYSIWYTGFPGISVVKSHMPMQETQVQSLGTEGPLEKEMITHSSILPWEILWTEEPGGLQTVGSQELDMS